LHEGNCISTECDIHPRHMCCYFCYQHIPSQLYVSFLRLQSWLTPLTTFLLPHSELCPFSSCTYIIFYRYCRVCGIISSCTKMMSPALWQEAWQYKVLFLVMHVVWNLMNYWASVNQLYEEESFQYAKFFHFFLNKKALNYTYTMFKNKMKC